MYNLNESHQNSITLPLKVKLFILPTSHILESEIKKCNILVNDKAGYDKEI